MSKLMLSLHDRTLSEHPIEKECVKIGRKPDNDIHIDNLAVSGHHAQIITILNDSFLEDLNSTNGTYVNAKLIKKHALKDGDVITIGKHTLKYVNEFEAPASAPQGEEEGKEDDDFEKTLIIRTDTVGMPSRDGAKELSEQTMGKLSAEYAEATKHAQHPDTQSHSAKLQILSGANTGKELHLAKALTTLGKPGAQVAAITRRPQGFFLLHIDGGPDNHRPLVNGDDIGIVAHPLSNHDVIEIAGVKMEFIVT
jgi:pSer/pThr/pTyr-binding forkhead associated (FHA) protein